MTIHVEAHFEKRTNGAAVTTANSNDNGDDPFNAFFMGGGATTDYDTTIAAHGTGSIKYGGLTGVGGAYAGWYFGELNATQAVARVYIRFTVLPNGTVDFFEFRATDNSSQCILKLNANGTVTFTAGGGNRYTSTTAITTNVWYRFEMGCKVATSGGQAKFSVYSGDATASALINYDSGTTLNTGSTPIYTSVVGKNVIGPTLGDFNVDDWGVMDGTLTYLGVYTPGPVLITNANQGVAVIDCTQSYVGVTGDSITYTISPSTGTTQPARGVFLVPEKPDSTNYTITATESNGKTDVQTVIVPPQLPGGLGFTTKRYSSGAWV